MVVARDGVGEGQAKQVKRVRKHKFPVTKCPEGVRYSTVTTVNTVLYT